jgi:hypothetical protein
MLTLLNVVENAAPVNASGRNASPVMSNGPDPNSVALYLLISLTISQMPNERGYQDCPPRRLRAGRHDRRGWGAGA